MNRVVWIGVAGLGTMAETVFLFAGALSAGLFFVAYQMEQEAYRRIKGV